MKAARRREIARWLVAAYGISVRHACRLTSLCRASYFYRSKAKDKTLLLVRLKHFAGCRIRYGYRRLHILLLRDGFKVNHKAVYRLYKLQGLELRFKKRRKCAVHVRFVGPRAQMPNERWSMDFMSDRLENGRRFRVLTLVDHFSRVSPALAAGVSLTAKHVVQVLEKLSASGLPRSLHVDNGPEFVSRALDAWAYRNKVQLEFSRPGKPTDNAWIESFNARFRAECLNQSSFSSVEEANKCIEEFRVDYNENRPHSALGYQTPAAFAGQFGYDQKTGTANSLTSLENGGRPSAGGVA